MKDINVPSYSSLLPKDRIIRGILDLYDYIRRWKQEIDAIEEAVPDEASSTNKLADRQWTDDEIAKESDFQKNLSAIMSLAVDPNAGVTIVTTNPEWKLVYTDADDRILLGKRQDNTWYFATDLDTILDVIIDGYTTT